MLDTRLDPLIHPLTRLSICAALSAVDWLEFSAVRDAVNISDWVLSKHARVLEDAGYLKIRKGAVDGVRFIRLSPELRVALLQLAFMHIDLTMAKSKPVIFAGRGLAKTAVPAF